MLIIQYSYDSNSMLRIFVEIHFDVDYFKNLYYRSGVKRVKYFYFEFDVEYFLFLISTSNLL